MTSLQDKIAALKAGDYDVVLEGTPYENNEVKCYEDVVGRSFYVQEVSSGEQLIHADAKTNAAKVIVLEEQVRVLREALVRAREDMEGWQGYASGYFLEKHAALADLLAIDEAIAATDMGES